MSERNGERAVAATWLGKRRSISSSTERRCGYGACARLSVTTAPKASWSSRRLFHAALRYGAASGVSSRPMVLGENHTAASPAGLKNASGPSGRPRKKSSLR